MARFLRLLAAVAALVALAACASRFATRYDTGVDPAVSKGWRLAHVYVEVPDSLSVNESDVLVPRGDIVWHGDPPGDRRKQVAAIVKQAVTQGARGLKGRRPVDIRVRLDRFHTLSPSAQALEFDNVGVLNVDFHIEVFDARTGKSLFGPVAIEAATPGLTGEAAIAATEQGNTQKRQILLHVRNVVAGWLGIGPDVRRGFNRLGA